jgi:hypothetical protein
MVQRNFLQTFLSFFFYFYESLLIVTTFMLHLHVQFKGICLFLFFYLIKKADIFLINFQITIKDGEF